MKRSAPNVRKARRNLYSISPKLKKHIGALVDWFSNNGFTVVFGKKIKSLIDFDAREVYINSSSSHEDQLHTLLHEAGHFLTSKRKDYLKDYSHGYASAYVEDAQKRASLKRTDRNKVHILDEEQEAWKTGLKLAKRLGIPVRREEYEKDRTAAVMGYIGWAHRKSRRGRKLASRRVMLIKL